MKMKPKLKSIQNVVKNLPKVMKFLEFRKWANKDVLIINKIFNKQVQKGFRPPSVIFVFSN